MNYILNEDWDDLIDVQSSEFRNLLKKVYAEYERDDIEVTPPKEDIFNAFKYTDYYDVDVVIIGQDPYPQKGVAHGLSFSTKASDYQSSLTRIYNQIEKETGVKIADRSNCDLTYLAKQGVLLLNVALTCKVDQRGSHLNTLGWEEFTYKVIDLLDQRGDCIFILLGNPAKEIGKRINNSKKIEGPHPNSSRKGNLFYDGCYFTKANEYLEYFGKSPIRWTVTEYNEYLSKLKTKPKTLKR